MTLDYFYGQAGELFSFYRIPKALFQEQRFQNLSTDAKTLYGILLDRMGLSVKNGWLDEQGRVYIIFPVQEVMDALKDHDESGYYITREIKVHERSEKEVASEMGITIGNLRVKMTRTKKWLCQHFADKARERGFL